MKKSKLYLVSVMTVFFFGLCLMCWFKGVDEYSDSERRVLADFPDLNETTISSGKFMKEFETYTLDQFPFRDTFRSIKATAQLGLFRQKDNNNIYVADGYVSKLEYPMNEYMLDNAAKKFRYLYDTYMADKDVNVFFSIVPDKNYFLAEANGYLSMDYEVFFDTMQEKIGDFMEYIDITDLLNIEDYYRTDTHWRQECLIATDAIVNRLPGAEVKACNMMSTSDGVANRIAEAMGNKLTWEYEAVTAEQPFYGVYVGQSALPLKPDNLTYLTNDKLEACKVTSYDTGMPKEKAVYMVDELDGKDPYEMFLAGSDALLVIDNPNATTDKELIVFRDSFGSSLLPLLIESYSKVTVVDIRYISSGMLGNFIEFDDQDVLFLYSTLVLNSSTSFK